MEALEHQVKALEEIAARARAYFCLSENSWQNLPIRPRWATILCAPTGSGKTTIASMVAHAVDASLIRTSVPSYMPCGAHQRGAKETICVIAEHVARNDRTILVLDEIDKMVTTTQESWRSYILSELYDLLDGRWPTGLREVEDDNDNQIPIESLTEKLRESVFILSIGTFQDWYDSPQDRRTIGFGESDEKKEISSELIAQKLPRELANRHNGSIVLMPELNDGDYRIIAQQTINKLPHNLKIPFKIEVERLIEDAIKAKKGVRYLEEAMMSTLVGLASNHSRNITPNQEQNPESNIDPCTL